MIARVDPRRLELLLELSRLGSMREVGEAMHVTTSTVSQQIAALAREAGTALIEPDGRRVRLTPAGRRLAGHAVTILAAIEAARRDLDPAAPPAGTVRVAAYASAFRQVLLPVARIMAVRQPEVRLHLLEQEPAEALALLAADEVDLVLTYDYNLAPARLDRGPHSQQLHSRSLGPTPWSLGTPSGPGPRGSPVRGVNLRRLRQPEVIQRSYAVTGRGHAAWPPLALVLRLIQEAAGSPGLARGAGVGGDGPPGHRARLGLVGAAGDVSFAPALAAERHEALALVGRRPGHTLLRVHGRAAGQVQAQAQDRRVPADADRCGAELGPPLVTDVRDVLDLQPGALGRLGREPDLDPAHLPAVLPGGGEAVRRITALDRAARVALELVAAAELQFPGDRQEPPRDAL